MVKNNILRFVFTYVHSWIKKILKVIKSDILDLILEWKTEF